MSQIFVGKASDPTADPIQRNVTEVDAGFDVGKFLTTKRAYVDEAQEGAARSVKRSRTTNADASGAPSLVDQPFVNDGDRLPLVSGTRSSLPTSTPSASFAASLKSKFSHNKGRQEWAINRPAAFHYAVMPNNNTLERQLSAQKGLFHWADVGRNETDEILLCLDVYTGMRLNAYLRKAENYQDGALSTIEKLAQRFRCIDHVQVVDASSQAYTTSALQSRSPKEITVTPEGHRDFVTNVWGDAATTDGTLLYSKLQLCFREDSGVHPSNYGDHPTIRASSSRAIQVSYGRNKKKPSSYLSKGKFQWELRPWATWQKDVHDADAYTDEADIETFKRAQSELARTVLLEFKSDTGARRFETLDEVFFGIRPAHANRERPRYDHAAIPKEYAMRRINHEQAKQLFKRQMKTEYDKVNESKAAMAEESKYDAKEAGGAERDDSKRLQAMSDEMGTCRAELDFDVLFKDRFLELIAESYRQPGKVFFHGMVTSVYGRECPSQDALRAMYTLNQTTIGNTSSADVDKCQLAICKLPSLQVAIRVGNAGALLLGM